MPANVTRTVREAVAVFSSGKDLEDAVNELEGAGFDRAMISLLADEFTVEEKLGHRYKRVEELEDSPDAPRDAFVSTESMGGLEGALIGGLTYIGAVAAAGAVVASGGVLGAAIGAAAMAGGAGAVIGSLLAKFVEEGHAIYLQEQIDRGGLLLWVRTVDAAHEKRAMEILLRNGAKHVHIHDIAA